MAIHTGVRSSGLFGASPKRLWALGLLCAGLLYTTFAMHLDERAFYSVKSAWHENSWEARSLWLPEYEVRVDALPVETVANNHSWLTFHDRRNHLWAIVNNTEEVVPLDKDCSFFVLCLVRRFSCVEGITDIGEGLLVLQEKRSQFILLGKV